MKKILFLFAALLLTAPAFAQSDEEEEIIVVKERSNAFFLGPKIGGTMTTMTQPEESKLYDASGMGFSAGVAMKARFGKASENSIGGTGYWGVGLELKYKRNSVKTVGIDEEGKEDASLSIDYFEVPVSVQLYPFAKSREMNSFYVELGVSFAGTISRAPKSLTVLNPGSDLSSVTYKLDADGSKLKGMDIRPMVGIGYTIPNTGLDVNGRYYFGTSKLAENFPCKMNSLEVSVAWLFNISKF